MQPIRFFSQDTVNQLRKGIRANLPWYRGETDIEPPSEMNNYNEMSKSVDSNCFDVLNSNATDEDDEKNVFSIYNALSCLTPQQAADERIWAYATHAYAQQYTHARWTKIPTDDEKAVSYILTHYFVSGSRGLIRDNAVARLWWMGYIASRCRDYKLEETLKILLRESDVRANLLERSSVSMSAEMFSGVIRALDNSIKQNPKDPHLFKRRVFRDLMKLINQRGGRIMLNTLDPKQLDNLINQLVASDSDSTTTKTTT